MYAPSPDHALPPTTRCHLPRAAAYHAPPQPRAAGTRGTRPEWYIHRTPTDSVPKTVTVEGPGYTIGGMAKGAGMLAPGLATMLSVITTDADLPAEEFWMVAEEQKRLHRDNEEGRSPQLHCRASCTWAVF